MKHATQREYFDYSFFEKLPATVNVENNLYNINLVL